VQIGTALYFIDGESTWKAEILMGVALFLCYDFGQLMTDVVFGLADLSHASQENLSQLHCPRIDYGSP
jgi:hypothetical protein